MADFLNNQLDFIFFFYGLAFILLGTTSSLAASKGAGEAWAVLGGFGFVHGVGEWLDLTALILGDSPAFAIARMTVMTASYLLLIDFVRLEAVQFGVKPPGRWIYAAPAILVTAVTVVDGPTTGGIVARYAIGFLGAAGAAIVLAGRARTLTGGAKGFAVFAAVGFGLYAVASGLIVPTGHFWPSTIVNYQAFTDLTGMPVQLVRGMLACWISFSIWGIWSQQDATDIASPRYSAYVRRHYIWTLVAMGSILVSGWALTQYLGNIYRQNVQKEARTDIELLASRLSADTTTINAMAKALAGSPTVLALLMADSPRDGTAVRSLLDLHVEASGAKRGAVLDRSGVTVTATIRDAPLPATSSDKPPPDFLAAIRGVPTPRFAFDQRAGTLDYSASYPVRTANGDIVGVAMLTLSLDSFEADLSTLDRPYFFVDPDGLVMMTNRPDSLYRLLWPLPDEKIAALGRRFEALNANPMLERRIIDAAWMTVDGYRDFVLRRIVNDSAWSLVILKPTQEIFATRFVGIVITLLVTIMALIYLLGRARRVHDEVQMDRRLQLQELAQDLGVKATTDTLTGLSNRLKLETALVEEVRRADRYGTPLTLIMFDIDHFKRINDTYGHPVGDKVLVRLSRRVSNLIRSSDLLVRWGGEEFLILAPGIDGSMGYLAAEKCRHAIETMRFDKIGTITSSFGVAQYVPGETGTAFVTRTDAALYQAKAEGRNRVVLATAQILREGGSAASA